MKKLIIIAVLAGYCTMNILNAQNISLYCTGNDTTGGTNSPTFFKLEPFSVTVTELNILSGIFGFIQGSSSFDNSNNHYLISGIDTNQVKRIYTIDTLGNILSNPVMSNLKISALQYDYKTGITYGFVADTSTNIRYLGYINTNTSSINVINELNVNGIQVGGVTFNSNSGKYIFIGPDLNYDKRIYFVNVLDGSIEYDILINDKSIGAIQYDNVNNKLYGVYRDTCCLMPKYFAEIDTTSADVTILDTLYDLYGTVSGSQEFDQESGTFIFVGMDTSQIKRLYLIDAQSGQVISKTPVSTHIGEIECDNTKFAKSFYTSVQDAKTLLSNISVYPNPANGHFEIEFTVENPQTVNISLVNSIGQIVYQKSNKNFQGNYSDKIDSRSFANGNYILNIKTGENTHTENITVLH